MYLPLLGEIVLISGVAAGEPGAAVAKVAGAAAAAGAAGIAAASVAAAGSTAYIAAATATATAARALTGYRVLAAGIAAGICHEVREGDALHIAAGVTGITGIACHKDSLQEKCRGSLLPRHFMIRSVCLLL